MTDKSYLVLEVQLSEKRRLIAAGRIGTPEEIASPVLWLSSPGAAFTTGQDILVDGGYAHNSRKIMGQPETPRRSR